MNLVSRSFRPVSAPISNSQVCWLRRIKSPRSVPGRYSSTYICAAQGEPEYFPASTSKEEWLKVDEKVNKYPSQRTFKAIGTAGSDPEVFVSSIVTAVEEAGDQAILQRTQVTQRPSKNGRYLSVSVSKIHVESGEQVYGIYEAIRTQCGDRLKFII